MRNIISIRWKILVALLILAVLPMLLLTYLFSDIASSQVEDQMELMADQAGRYIMQGVSQKEDSLLEDMEILGKDEEMLNAIYFGQITGDPEQLHHLMKHNGTQFGFDLLELVHADGHRHVLEANGKNAEPKIIKKVEGKKVEFSTESDSQLTVQKNRLAIIATVPLNFQGSLIGNLRAYHYIDQKHSLQLQDMIGADIAFHDGKRIVTTSLEELKNLQKDLDQTLDEDAVHMYLRGQEHIVYNYPLNHESAGFLIALDSSSIQIANKSMQRTLVLISLAVMTIAIALGIIISRSIARPLDSVVANLQEIAEGEADLTKTLDIHSNDEVGMLANSFNLFVERLRGIVENSRKAATGLTSATATIRSRSSEVSAAAVQQTKALEQTHTGITEIGATSGEIADNVSNLVAAVQESAAATHELESTTFSIGEQMENLFGIISDISSSIHQLSSSNEQVDGNIIELTSNARETSKSADELEQATSVIEKSAKRTSQLAQQAASDALEGKAAVQDTIRGISDLEEMMEQAYMTIQDLGERSDAIGNIINVIAEVADQTNLLALNAAIIAAQAGEHGQGFAVVAEEIRNLAERTSVSTKEIAEIIENLQQGTKTAVSTIEAGTLRAQQEVARSAAAGEALEKLHESSLISTEQITGIAKQTQKQSAENRNIAKAMLGITKMLDQIATSIGQQTASTRNLSEAAESMKNIAAKVKNSTGEQNRGSQQISQSMEHIQQMIERIDTATRHQDERSNEVVKSVAMVHRIAEENADRANGMDSVVESLIEHTDLLQKEMGAFKIDNEEQKES
ncbi:Methyl-accepting chemotaxis protein [Malonomonas rubra DSM 5091]|uniref:Methyl-accepting chemotaxis protein n=1 Tax=Malonomonas rubra DSM 5091 TaxID=1122189 RepID=A0A1M6FBV1_MALRU|nr:methyl-accepting chemotaxis protein [Malonomonas rubra]SHI95089.1 Methyl-accepting chemotaxis protein [Malonomonas rubra DSM 5091]